MLPTSGPLTWAMINAELGRSPRVGSHLNDTAVRALAEKASGTIAYSDLRGKQAALLRTTLTIAKTYTTVHLSSGRKYGEGFGFGRNYERQYYGDIPNRSVAGKRIFVVQHTPASSHNSFAVVGTNNGGTWWQTLEVGATLTTRLTSGYNLSKGWWANNTFWSHGTNGNGTRRDLTGPDILGGRRSGTHTLTIT